ncbi:MAG: tripartite tricarboxylate transporter TctB family protein [Deltaproteobacteria bacterium]|nr:tripartite tricarboxylate transporter TctB family protein [Deltaproteobacteria bacterium]
MKVFDQLSSIFWFVISTAVFIESIRLGIGKIQNPGVGFITLGASGILGILSFVLFIKATLTKEEKETEPLFSKGRWPRVLFVLFILCVYSVVMPTLGYLLSTFILMTFLFWVLERRKIWLVFTASFLSTLISYFVFSKWLNCQFPDGLFGL